MLKVANGYSGYSVQELVVLSKEFCVCFKANEVNCSGGDKRAQSGVDI